MKYYKPKEIYMLSSEGIVDTVDFETKLCIGRWKIFVLKSNLVNKKPFERRLLYSKLIVDGTFK